jgi:hypothetical protein
VGFTLASAAAALPGLPVRVRVPGGPVLDAARAPGAALAAAHAALAAALLAAPSALWAPPPQEEPPLAVLRDEESEDKARLDSADADVLGDSGASPSAPLRVSVPWVVERTFDCNPPTVDWKQRWIRNLQLPRR